MPSLGDIAKWAEGPNTEKKPLKLSCPWKTGTVSFLSLPPLLLTPLCSSLALSFSWKWDEQFCQLLAPMAMRPCFTMCSWQWSQRIRAWDLWNYSALWNYFLPYLFIFLCFNGMRMGVLSACMSVHFKHAWCWSQRPWNWSYRRLWAAVWVLGFKP